jgi:hypothetical protein
MTNFKKTVTLVFLASAVVTSTSQASLIDRGNGLLYDDVLNVTWLQDANYAHTSGYAGANSLGQMDWSTATTWATDLVYGGYSDWRLASNSPVNGSSFSFNGYLAYDGSTDNGYNITGPHAELAYMYHVNLGLKGYFDTTRNVQSDFGIFGNGTYNGVDNTSWGQTNVKLVNNLQNYVYWSGSTYNPPYTYYALIFDTYNGSQSQDYKVNQLYAWAVRPGDVAASSVPVPAAVWLFGSGLIGLASFTRRKNKSSNLIAA